MMATKTKIALSTKPWSDFSEADYSLSQWHNACLIHDHAGPPTSKSQCKLPIKTPEGVVNRNGLFAAAAALAGARTPMKATSQQKNQAAKKLLQVYKQIGQTPPHSLYVKHSDSVNDILEHHGIKGMHWGIRRSKKELARHVPSSEDFKRAKELSKRPTHSLTNEELRTLNQRQQLETQHRKLNPGTVAKGKVKAEFIMGTIGVGLGAAKLFKKPILHLGERTVSKLLLRFHP